MDAIDWAGLVAALIALITAITGLIKARTAVAEATDATRAAEMADSHAEDAHNRLDKTDAAIGSNILGGGAWSSRDDGA